MGRLRPWHVFAVVALAGAAFIVWGLHSRPTYLDAFYHYNAAERLVTGLGLTDPYLWVYIGLPEALPAPSHIYWMPLTSLLAAAGMWLLNAPGSYAAAQLPLVALLAGTAGTGYWLGWRLGGTVRHAWFAGLLSLTGGYYLRFWGTTDTFTPYALVGALALVFIGLAAERGALKYWLLAGALAGLAHLTRADGLLLLLVAWAVLLWPWAGWGWARRLQGLALVTLVYLLVMAPWFARNMQVMGTPLPVGGAQGIWYTGYDDIFNYPPEANPATFFEAGVGELLRTRWEALVGTDGGFGGNLGTLIAVEGLIVLFPFMLLGLWVRRRDAFVRGFALYALGVHVVMTLVFPYPGLRGGLFHSASALLPWWMALAGVGIDSAVNWVAARRRTWNATTARWFFTVGLLALALLLSFGLVGGQQVAPGVPAVYVALDALLPPDARVMSNDPPQLYYFTGRGGVVLPNESPDVIPEIAARYGIDYLLIESISADGRRSNTTSAQLWPILYTDYEFLVPVDIDVAGVRLYAIQN